jgi:UDP-glucose 4-epimerase
MNVVVTGGAGFIGSRLTELLLKEGHEATVIDNLSAGSRENVPPGASFVQADVKDRRAMREVLSEDIDRVYHLAAARDVSIQEEDRETDVQENVVGTHTLLEAMYKEGVTDIVFTSSSVVYGEPDEFPTPEGYGPMEPISLYGATKLSAESLICTYAKSFGFEATSLRLANIIGPRSDHGVIPDFIEKLEENDDVLHVLGNGKQRKSYLHVDDCVKAILTAARNRKYDYEVFNVGNEDAVAVSRIVELVIEAFGCDARIEYEGSERGWTGDVTEMLLDISRLSERGWTLSMTSEEAVRKTAERLIAALD